MRLCTLVISAMVAGCQCAELPTGVRFKCEHDSECLKGTEVCGADGYCAAKSGAGGGSGGGSGGGAAGGGAAGGATAGGTGGSAGGTCVPDGGFDWPDDAYTDNNCDGIDGTIQGGVFVDTVVGQPGNPGTIGSPVKSLDEGLRLAADGGAHSIFVGGTTYSPSATLRWTGRASIFGGYDLAWQRVPSRVTINGAAIAMMIDGDAGRTLMNVDVSSANASAPSQPSIALVVDGAQLNLVHVNLKAGDGADGGDALTPPPAATGGPGGDGAWGRFCNDGGTCVAARGGDGGTNPACGLLIGRRGGNGAVDNVGGQMGEPSTTAGGSAQTQPMDCQSCPCTNVANYAANGMDGLQGNPGPGGVASTSGGGSRGDVDGGAWVAANGGRGGDGDAGTFGNAGGGGGAVIVTGNSGAIIGGSAGGGAGAPGCGGIGGPGGAGGGASIAVLLARGAKLDATTDVHLATGRGGHGGAGARGSAGGMGGAGGAGGPLRHPVCGSTGMTLDDPTGIDAGSIWSGAGGNGGQGGQGGLGGSGAGGGGGPSIAIFCAPGATRGTPVFTPGLGGAAGFGAIGAVPGSMGDTAMSVGCGNF